jgi:CRP-like cAMP-binding protein
VTAQETFELMSYAAGYSQYWRGFISGELEVLSKVMILQRVQKGEQMLVSGEAATFFGLVISGSVKVHDPRYNVNR